LSLNHRRSSPVLENDSPRHRRSPQFRSAASFCDIGSTPSSDTELLHAHREGSLKLFFCLDQSLVEFLFELVAMRSGF